MNADTFQCSSWIEFQNWIGGLPDQLKTDQRGQFPVFHLSRWVFRGHADASWNLASALERDSRVQPLARCEIALHSAERFARSARLFGVPQTVKLLDWHALMQHHGSPTLLMDWTYSPEIALYFALREKRALKDGPGGTRPCVWALDAGYLDSLFASIVNPGVPSMSVPQAEFHYGQFFLTPAEGVSKNPEKDLQRRPAWVERAPGLVTVLRPQSLTHRQLTQQSVFLFNARPELSFEDSLAGMCRLDDSRDVLQKIEISMDALDQFRLRLDRANINEMSMFPDLDGFARYCYEAKLQEILDSHRRVNSHLQANSGQAG